MCNSKKGCSYRLVSVEVWVDVQVGQALGSPPSHLYPALCTHSVSEFSPPAHHILANSNKCVNTRSISHLLLNIALDFGKSEEMSQTKHKFYHLL